MSSMTPTQILMERHYLASNISETVQYIDIFQLWPVRRLDKMQTGMAIYNNTLPSISTGNPFVCLCHVGAIISIIIVVVVVIA